MKWAAFTAPSPKITPLLAITPTRCPSIRAKVVMTELSYSALNSWTKPVSAMTPMTSRAS